MFSLRFFLICAVLSLSTVGRAQIVECVDANGKKIYSQSCPAGAEQKREINQVAPPKPSPSNNASNEAAKKALQEQEALFEARRNERLKAEARDEEQQKKSAEAVQLCANAKLRLEVLGSGRQFKRADPETGEHVPMDEDQRQAEIEKMNTQIQNNCQ